MSDLYPGETYDTAPDSDTHETDTTPEPEFVRERIDTDPEYYDDSEAPLAEEEDDGEFQTRQEAAEEDREWDGREWDDTDAEHEPDSGAESRDDDADAFVETPTRQEAADEDRVSDQADSSTDTVERNDAEATDTNEPTPEERTRWHDMYQDYLKEQESDQGTGWSEGANVVGDKDDRSPGDTADLPPTGQELLDMDSDTMSTLDRLRNRVYEDADDVLDIAEKTGNRGFELFDRPPTAAHTETPVGHPEFTVPDQHGVEGGQIVVAGLVVGMLGYEAARAVRHKITSWRKG
jgi:hypothetical protein